MANGRPTVAISRTIAYSPLDQISATNFSELELAWRLNTDSFGPRPESLLQTTPLMVNGVLYATVGTRRAAVALDAATGELLWMHRVDEGERGETAPRRLSGRGLTYFDDGGSGMVLYVTPGYQLIALDASNGRPREDFGKDGNPRFEAEHRPGPGGDLGDRTPRGANCRRQHDRGGCRSPPGGAPPSRTNVKGYLRGFDVRTGERKWIFHTIPMSDEFGNDTWGNDSWRYTGNTGVCGPDEYRPRVEHGLRPRRGPDR